MMDEALHKTEEELRVQCKIETRYPFTMNEEHLIRYHGQKYGEILDFLLPVPDNQPSENDIKGLLEKLRSVSGVSISSLESLLKNLRVPNEYAEELNVVSGALAYFEIACQRVIDSVPMRIEEHLVYDFSKSVEEKLDDTVGLVGEGGAERCAAWVKDDPKIEFKRDNLAQQKEILVKAIEILGSI